MFQSMTFVHEVTTVIPGLTARMEYSTTHATATKAFRYNKFKLKVQMKPN